MRWITLEPSTKVILKIILALLVLAFLWVVRDLVITVLLAVVLASAMEPLVAYLNKHRVPRVVSVLAVYVLVLGVIGLILALIVPVVVEQFNLLAASLPTYTQQLQQQFPIIQTILGNANLGDVLRNIFTPAVGGESVVSRTVGVFNGVFSVITILVVSFYLVAEQKGMLEFIRSLVPPKHQDFAVQLVGKIQVRMGRWVIGQFILSCAIFVLTFAGLSILGVKYALFLALLAGLLEVVPYIGPIISAIPAIFFALGQSPALAAVVLVLYIVVQKTEGYLLVPKVMERTVGTSPLLVLISLLVGLKLAGVMGLLLAVPLVSAITLVVSELSANQMMSSQPAEPMP
jgi:predicted PurR-regulated permease PerM